MPPSGLIVHWLAMLLAMMPLLIWRPMARLAAQSASFWTFARWLAGYSLVWTVAGLATAPAVIFVLGFSSASNVSPIIIALALALLWQVTPNRANALAACARAADSAAAASSPMGSFTHGARLGATCLMACGPWMLLPMLVHTHARLMMAVIMGLLVFEREIAARNALPRDFSFKPAVVGD
jgi:hypothetical protein